MKKIHRKGVAGYAPTLAAGFLLALAFTFTGCEEKKKPSSDVEDTPAQTESGSDEKLPENMTIEGSTESIFTDSRDGKKYKTTKIGEQVWMAENLNYKTPEGSWGFKEHNECGRWYDWNTAITVCPSGWHLPSRNEWSDLVTTVGSNAGTELKVKGNIWNDVGWNGTDNYGFSALPCGIHHDYGGFGSIRYFGYWWTVTGSDSGKAYYIAMQSSGSEKELVAHIKGKVGLGLSVRCIRD
jgi:uncharacterized protein (TIGR02145 family)